MIQNGSPCGGQCHVHRRTSSGRLRKRSDAALSGLCTFSGSALRFTLDNYCGKEPVTIHRATVAVCDSDLTGKVPLSCPLAAGTIRDITFDGSHSVTLAAGASAASDALSFPVSAGQTLCVSLYFDGYTAMQSAVLITGPLSRGYFSYGDQTHSESAAPCHLQGDKLVLFS